MARKSTAASLLCEVCHDGAALEKGRLLYDIATQT